MECGDRRGWGEGKVVLSRFSTEALIFDKVQRYEQAVGRLYN